ncbi:MAG: hypothetical protein AMK69_17485, partial [Nitrospira bacterium SG8_3]
FINSWAIEKLSQGKIDSCQQPAEMTEWENIYQKHAGMKGCEKINSGSRPLGMTKWMIRLHIGLLAQGPKGF